MVFLYDKKLPENKSFTYSLTVIFGLGKRSSQKICKKLGFCLNLKTLSKLQVTKLTKVLSKANLLFGNQLKRFKVQNLKEKLKIKVLKSFRLLQGLPIRGQRTHTNAKTAKKKSKMNFVKVMLFDYLNLFVLFLVASKLAIILVLVSYVFVLEDPDSEKLSTYECGYEPYESSRHIFNIRFFLIAILFVIFDIEMLFLIPWCVSMANINLLSFWSTIDFIFELGVGFFYVWYTNSLNWQ